jgi:hypothetical protein
MTKFAFCMMLFSVLSGCITAEQAAQRQQEQRLADDTTCQSYGVKPGSDAYVACRMNLGNNRAMQETLAEQDRQRMRRQLVVIGHCAASGAC